MGGTPNADASAISHPRFSCSIASDPPIAVNHQPRNTSIEEPLNPEFEASEHAGHGASPCAIDQRIESGSDFHKSSPRVSADDEPASSSLQRLGIGRPSRVSSTITLFSVGRNTCEEPSCSGHRHNSTSLTVPHFKADRSRATSGIGPTFQANALLAITPITSIALATMRDHRMRTAPIA